MIRIRLKSVNVFVCALTLCFAVRGVSDGMLAFVNSTYAPILSLLTILMIYITLPLGFVSVYYKRLIKTQDLMLVLLPLCYLLMLIFNTYGGYSGEWITAFIAIAFFLMMTSNQKVEIYKCFYWIIQICNIISVILYLFAILKINIGFSTVEYYTGITGTIYYKWGIFAILKQGLSQLRLCGIFNEPGVLGTICAFLFITCKNSISRWERVLLLVTIVFSFSMAGYLLIYVYMALYLLKKDWKYIIPIAMLGYALFFLPNIDFGNETLNYLMGRFKISDTGLIGDKRYDQAFDTFYQSFIHSKKAVFGLGYGHPEASGVSTYKQLIVQFGFVGFVLYCFSMLLMSMVKSEKNINCLILVFLFMISIYQRPLAASSLYGYIVLFGGIEFIKLNEEIKNNIT